VKVLSEGGSATPGGKIRRPWQARSINKVIAATARLLEDAHRQGHVPRNVAAHVERVHTAHTDVPSLTKEEVQQLLSSVEGDRMAHAWHLALSGLRRGEICALRWEDVSFDNRAIAIRRNRVDAGGRTVEGDTKSFTSRRTLPLPESLLKALIVAHDIQRDECELARAAGLLDARMPAYVVCNEVGQAYSPQTLSRFWRQALADAGLRHIKLHAARHTCATLMHLNGTPVAVIAAWIGHKDAALTMRLYSHSQDDALRDAADTIATLSATQRPSNSA
jgi:integrase